MKKVVISGALVVFISLCLAIGHEVAGQGRGRGGAAAAAPEQPTVFMGCVSGGNLQPVEQPFVLEPAEPFVLTDVLTRADSGFAPTNYRVTGISLTPWLGMRVRVEGAVVPPAPGASGPDALPEIKATRVTSVWGTCPSPAAWTPPSKD